MSEFYIYKYVIKDNIIYIGKTNTSLYNRIKSHSKEEKFKEYKDANVYCFQCKNRIETDIYEKYLINKYKPILNVMDKISDTINIDIKEKDWMSYEEYLKNRDTNSKEQKVIEKCGVRNVYPIFLTCADNIILAESPDFETLTEGTDLYAAINNIRDAIELKCVSMEDDNEKIPSPSDLKDLDITNGTFANDGETIVSFVDIDSAIYRKKIDTKTVRRNVALPSWLNYEADQAGVNVSRILQEALMNVLKVENRM